MPTSIDESACERSTRGSSSTPPWCLIARTVVTSTTALGGQAAEPADDVEELLHPHVGAEAGLGHHVVGDLHPDLVGDERVVAVGDVRERAAVHQARLALERLDQVRLDRVLEQHGHRAGRAEVLGGDRLAAVERARHGDAAEPRAQVLEVLGDREDRHHLRGRGDVEAGLARVAVRAAAEADGDVAQRAVVHVERAPPADAQRVDLVRVAVQDRRVEHRRQQVVGGADRVDVAGEVEVEVLHRHHLCHAAAGGAALDAEHRAERRLAQAGDRLLADVAETLGEADERRRLALAGLRRRHAGHAHELAVGPVAQAVDDARFDLALVATVGLDLLGLQAAGLARSSRSGPAPLPVRSRGCSSRVAPRFSSG